MDPLVESLPLQDSLLQDISSKLIFFLEELAFTFVLPISHLFFSWNFSKFMLLNCLLLQLLPPFLYGKI
ncbi:unnamed protein product [Orchesella dallaii]|uniref:Uncharacterized protein n=1 Tax=Orchesella dallaii TaxID=48710 RepID=A0ABP1RWW6_9HEXA